MRVCFIISGIAYSGAEIVLERYLKNNTLIDPYFILIYDKQEIYKKLCDVYGESKVYKLNIKHNKHRLRIIPKYDAKLIKDKIITLIDKIKPSIIYANNTMETMLLNEYAKNSEVPCVAHIHDMKMSIRSIIRRKYTEQSLTVYDKIIMVSEATKAQWCIENAEVIYNNLDDDYFKNESKQYKTIENIGIVGTISHRKGSDLVLESIDDLCKLGVQLNIVYNHGDEKLISGLIDKKNKYSNQINIYNNLNSEEIKDFYDKMDLIIVPSRQDPLPTVVIESMARRTIVTGSRIDGIPEMIKDHRLLFSQNSKDEIVLKVKELLKYSNEDLNNISQSQYEYCKQNFSREIKVNKINDMFMSLIKDYKILEKRI